MSSRELNDVIYEEVLEVVKNINQGEISNIVMGQMQKESVLSKTWGFGDMQINKLM
jgi:hypothetical protein